MFVVDLTALKRIHKIAGPDGHTLSTLLYTSVHQLADYIPHNLYPVFDVISFDRVLRFWSLVASILGNNRDIVLGVVAFSFRLVCTRRDSTRKIADIQTAD